MSETEQNHTGPLDIIRTPITTAALREKIAADIDVFLAAGGQIQRVPFGVIKGVEFTGNIKAETYRPGRNPLAETSRRGGEAVKKYLRQKALEKS